VGWDLNISENGLVVNGNDVTIYGLFVEHHQQFQVLWKGNRGRTYFYQSEIPYDPPAQASYTSAQGVNGWASYKVADEVTNHEAWGLGVYSVFIYPNVVLTRAIETPKSQEIRFHDIITVALGEHASGLKPDCLTDHKGHGFGFGFPNLFRGQGAAVAPVQHFVRYLMNQR
jgi:hypothetical protein